MPTSDSEVDLATPGTILKEKWKIVKKIGGGGFGQIYEAVDVCTKEIVAIKTEGNSIEKQVLKMEVAVLKALQGQRHICRFYGCGRHPKFNYLVMTLQGKCLTDLRKQAENQTFSLSTTVRLARQMVESIHVCHEGGFLHRDIKPSNFAIGGKRETRRIVYVLDFGLARVYVNENGTVRNPRRAAGFRGTVRYASIACHENRDLGRVDDFWSLFYVFVEFLNGQLPWRKIKEKGDVLKSKQRHDPHSLVRNMPDEFAQIVSHLKTLTYYDKPDYDLIKCLLDKIMLRKKIRQNDPFDWEVHNSSKHNVYSYYSNNTSLLREICGRQKRQEFMTHKCSPYKFLKYSNVLSNPNGTKKAME